MSGLEALTVTPLREDLTFGARINGLTRDLLAEAPVRDELKAAFDKHGLLVFEDVEQSAAMQVELSNVFGPLKDHPVKIVERTDQRATPGVIAIRADPAGSIVEIDGRKLASWQPWHFDHSYNDELNRGGVLRGEVLSPEGGETAFVDGIQIYNAMSADLRQRAEEIEVIYTLDQHYERQWFGLPAGFREIQPKTDKILEIARQMPRAFHPAVWQRRTGEKVAHLSPYGARGIKGLETQEGQDLLRAIWTEVERVIEPYHHVWRARDMVVWDNWRMLHSACGCDPKYERVMHRTTIKGDYGLGYFEGQDRRQAEAERAGASAL